MTLGGSQSRCECCGEEKYFGLCRKLSRPSHSLHIITSEWALPAYFTTDFSCKYVLRQQQFLYKTLHACSVTTIQCMCHSVYATGWDVQGIIFRSQLEQEGNLFSKAPTAVHPTFCVMCTRDSLLGVKELWCEAEHSLPCGAGVNYKWSRHPLLHTSLILTIWVIVLLVQCVQYFCALYNRIFLPNNSSEFTQWFIKIMSQHVTKKETRMTSKFICYPTLLKCI